jgi:hypothetical protein
MARKNKNADVTPEVDETEDVERAENEGLSPVADGGPVIREGIDVPGSGDGHYPGELLDPDVLPEDGLTNEERFARADDFEKINDAEGSVDTDSDADTLLTVVDDEGRDLAPEEPVQVHDDPDTLPLTAKEEGLATGDEGFEVNEADPSRNDPYVPDPIGTPEEADVVKESASLSGTGILDPSVDARWLEFDEVVRILRNHGVNKDQLTHRLDTGPAYPEILDEDTQERDDAGLPVEEEPRLIEERAGDDNVDPDTSQVDDADNATSDTVV